MFPILYSRTSTGAVQQWQIIVEGDQYWTESGQVDGAKTKSKPTIVKGKNIGRANATTAEEQALKDAQSKYDKQLKTGYFEDINEIDNLKYIEPMLAKAYKDRADKVNHKGALVQCKYNGARCVAINSGLFSRKGEQFLAVPHIEESLSSFFVQHPNAFLDGELFNESLRQQLNEIMSLIRRTKHFTDDHFARSREMIKFYVYDGYGFEGTTKDTPYKERKAIIDRIVKEYPFLEFVETIEVNTPKEMWAVYDNYVAQGHEGAILRFPDSPYEHKRSSLLLKLKPTDDAEFEVIGVEEGAGNWSGIAKIINCRMDDGREFNATFKGTMAQAKEFLDNKDKYIGKKYTIFYNGFTGKGEGLPNYAQFDYANSVEESNK